MRFLLNFVVSLILPLLLSTSFLCYLVLSLCLFHTSLLFFFLVCLLLTFSFRSLVFHHFLLNPFSLSFGIGDLFSLDILRLCFSVRFNLFCSCVCPLLLDDFGLNHRFIWLDFSLSLVFFNSIGLNSSFLLVILVVNIILCRCEILAPWSLCISVGCFLCFHS